MKKLIVTDPVRICGSDLIGSGIRNFRWEARVYGIWHSIGVASWWPASSSSGHDTWWVVSEIADCRSLSCHLLYEGFVSYHKTDVVIREVLTERNSYTICKSETKGEWKYEEHTTVIVVMPFHVVSRTLWQYHKFKTETS